MVSDRGRSGHSKRTQTGWRVEEMDSRSRKGELTHRWEGTTQRVSEKRWVGAWEASRENKELLHGRTEDYRDGRHLSSLAGQWALGQGFQGATEGLNRTMT